MSASFKLVESSMERRPAGSALMAKLAVITVTFNSAEVLEGLLDSLAPGLEGVENHEIIVVDNDSKDRSVEIALGHALHPRVIQTGRNAGYAAAINIATATIDDETDVLVLNPDVRLERGTVRRLRATFSDPSVGAAVPQIRHEDGTLSKSIRREPSIRSAWSEALLGGLHAARLGLGEMVDDPAVYQTGGAIEWASGAIVLISAYARRRVGGWDESFFLYSEEVDFFQRLRAAGLTASYVPEAQAVHIGGDYQKSSFLTSLMTTNRIKYYRRHHSALATALFRLGIIVGEAVRLPKGKNHRAAFMAAIGI